MRFPSPAGLPACLALALLAGAARADLKQSLALFFDLGGEDSVTAIVQTSPTALEVKTVDMTTTEPKSFAGEVGAKPMAKILSEARAESVPVTEWSPQDPAAAPAPAVTESAPSEAPAAPPSDIPRVAQSRNSQSRNRTWYLLYQVPLSTWVFGSSIPVALEVKDVKVHVAMPLLMAPVSFAAHLWFSKSRPFEDAHFLGTRYLSLFGLGASYALPMAFMEDPMEGFKTGVFVSLLGYPAGLVGGHLLGDRYLDMPGRIETQSKFATGFGVLGFFSPFLYFEHMDDNIESIMRLALGQSVGFAAAGHFISEYYRSGENIPGGVTTGILNHAALGAGLGAEIAALSDASTVRPWLGAALAGGTLGFMEGLLYYRNRYDNHERGIYNGLGTLAGLAMGGGVVLLLEDNWSGYEGKVGVTSFLVGGALMGFIATDLLTRGMEDRPARGGRLHWTDRLALHPIPVPEPEVRPGTSPARPEVSFRYRVPGLQLTF